MLKHSILALASFTACALPAAAQDFGTDWIDRVTQQLAQERGPLSSQPWDIHATGGVALYIDDNIYLTEEDEVDSPVIIPFLRATATYSEPRFEFHGDLLVNYKYYTDEEVDDFPGDEEADDDEQRLYLRVRQAGTRYSLELAQIFQRVSDPVGVLFLERAERFISNTVPRVEFDMSRQWAIEASANYQIVRYDDADLGAAVENNAGRVEGALVYRTASGYDLLAQIGWQDISYRGTQGEGAPPDAFGWYGRLGWRGYLLERLYAEVLLGFDTIESDYFAGTSRDVDDSTMGAYAILRYEISETVRWSLEYSRQFTFLGAGDPYQRVDRLLTIFDVEFTESVGGKLRGQFDQGDSALGTLRTYWSAGADVWFKPLAWMVIDGGVTARGGEIEHDDIGIDSEYDNVIFHVGVAATY